MNSGYFSDCFPEQSSHHSRVFFFTFQTCHGKAMKAQKISEDPYQRKKEKKKTGQCSTHVKVLCIRSNKQISASFPVLGLFKRICLHFARTWLRHLCVSAVLSQTDGQDVECESWLKSKLNLKWTENCFCLRPLIMEKYGRACFSLWPHQELFWTFGVYMYIKSMFYEETSYLCFVLGQ